MSAPLMRSMTRSPLSASLALLAHGLAFARGEIAEEILEGGVAFVAPMELLVGALQVALGAERGPFALAEERRVHRGGAEPVAELGGGGGEHAGVVVGVRAGPHQQPPPRHGRERHGDLQFRIVAAARVLVGRRPGVIEHVFAGAVAASRSRGRRRRCRPRRRRP